MIGEVIIVPPYGLTTARIASVGEQPGRTEAWANPRRPFIGEAGKYRAKTFHTANMPIGEVYDTNAISQYGPPLNHYVTFIGNSKVIKELTPAGEIERERLTKELNSLPNLKVVIAFGGVALYMLTGLNGIKKWAGSVLPCLLTNCLVVPTYHPAMCTPEKHAFEHYYLIVEDLKRALEVLNGTFNVEQPILMVRPTFEQAIDFMQRVLAYDSYVGFDIETAPIGHDAQISCFALAIGNESMCIPFIEGRELYFELDEELYIMRLLNDILTNKKVKRVGQNMMFESAMLHKRYGIQIEDTHDTMVAQHTLYTDYPKDLGFITRMWTNQNYYKDEGKTWRTIDGGSGDIEQWWRYNAKDAWVCVQALPKQLARIEHMNNTPAYIRKCSIIPILSDISARGISVDVKRMERDRKGIAVVKRHIHNSLANLVPNYKETFCRSSKQIADYFQSIGAPQYKGKKGEACYDDMALAKLERPLASRPGYPVAGLIRRFRKLAKLESSYMTPKKIDSDGRIRCSYNPVGTRYARISSSENIFGSGMNMQNWPHPLLEYLLPDEGYIYIAFDLSMVENRIVAYEANEANMIAAFESGKDLHCLTAVLIFGGTPEEIKKEDDEGIPAPIGGEDEFGSMKTKRARGKQANHAFNYDEGPDKFALLNGLAPSEGRTIHSAYHNGYPNIRAVYHAGIRDQVRRNKFVVNLMGRKVGFLGAADDETFRAAFASVPQGTVGDMVDEAMLKIHKMKELDILLQVHDSIGCQVRLNLGWLGIAQVALEFKSYMERTLTSSWGREFKIPADLTISPTLRKESGFDLKSAKIPSDPVVLAGLLESKWNAIMEKRAIKTYHPFEKFGVDPNGLSTQAITN